MLTANSWADALHAARTPTDKAKILLQRAQQRQSKKLIEQDINEAVILINPCWSPSLLVALLASRDIPYSQVGLHKLAAHILTDLETE